MHGPNLLFAAVFGDDKFETEYYTPAGTWTTITPLIGIKRSRVVVGPRWVKEAVPIDEIPAFVRPGSRSIGPPGIKKPEFNLSDRVECPLVMIVATLHGTREGDRSTIKIVKDSLEKWSIRLFKNSLMNVSDIQGATLDGVNALNMEDSS